MRGLGGVVGAAVGAGRREEGWRDRGAGGQSLLVLLVVRVRVELLRPVRVPVDGGS